MIIYKVANDFWKTQKIMDFDIVSSVTNPSDSDEIIAGAILYNGMEYKFKYHHDFDNGNAYIVYDDVGNSKFYFALYFNEITGKMEKNENI